MISEKIRPHHLERKALLYVRQSSAYQVPGFFYSLIPVTIGNIIGGGGLVGGVYWFVYLRTRRQA